MQKSAKARKLEDKIQDVIRDTYSFELHVITRTVNQIKHSISSNSFLDSNETERLHLTFLKEIPNTLKLKKIQRLKTKQYLFFEKKPKVTATTQN